MRNKNANVLNFLTFDIEEWYHANYESVDFSIYKNKSTNLEALVDRIIEICEEYSVKTTCFIVGAVAKQKPQIVKKLMQAGHEIASHSYNHELVYNMTPQQFKKDLKQSCIVLEDITGKKVSGFRAPSWSVRRDMLEWYYDILDDSGIKYSSSIFPLKNFLYGIPDFPPHIHKPLINNKPVSVVEIPSSVINIMGKKIGFSGGFYFRFLPLSLVNRIISSKNIRKEPTVVYLHPREIDITQPHLKLGTIEKFIHYYGINNCEDKLRKCLDKFASTFVNMGSYVEHKEYRL